jgi:hypothetical protein
VDKREVATIVALTREVQRIVDALQRGLRGHHVRLELREQRLKKRHVDRGALIGTGRQLTSKFSGGGGRIIEAATGPSGAKSRPPTPKRHPVVARARFQSLRGAQSGSCIPAQDFEMGSEEKRIAHRRDMAEPGRASVRHLDQFARAVDLAQLPGRDGQTRHDQRAGVLAETLPRLLFMSGGAGFKRPLAMGSGVQKITGKVTDQCEAAVGNASFDHAPRILGFLEERRGQLTRRP